MVDDIEDDEDITRVGSRAEMLAERKQRVSVHPYLMVVAGASVGRLVRIDGRMTLGRSGDAELRLDEDGVSRRHAALAQLPDGTVEISDLGSTNGTFVNDERVERRVLRDGDRVVVGGATILKFSYQDAVEEALQRNLYASATRDALTGAHNRRWFDEAAARELAFSKRHDRPLALVLVDIDHFKRVNDTFGHPAGDAVLRTVGEIVIRTVRREDAVARYGGEELAILLRDTNLVDAATCAERVRSAIAAARVDYESNIIQVTASFGVAVVRGRDCASPTDLVRLADERLYSAKERGRNRVETEP